MICAQKTHNRNGNSIKLKYLLNVPAAGVYFGTSKISFDIPAWRTIYRRLVLNNDWSVSAAAAAAATAGA